MFYVYFMDEERSLHKINASNFISKTLASAVNSGSVKVISKMQYK